MENMSWEENLKARYEHEQRRIEAQKRVPCEYCGKPVPSVFVWTQAPSSDDLFQEAGGKFFHTDCYGAWLIQRRENTKGD